MTESHTVGTSEPLSDEAAFQSDLSAAIPPGIQGEKSD